MITENIDNINTTNIIISNHINNSIIPNSKYYKIIYSNQFFSTYSLYMEINFKNVKLNACNNSIYIDNVINKDLISKISNIESIILDRFSKNKNTNYKLNELLNNRFIKYTPNNNNNNVINVFNDISNNIYNNYDKPIILKISGVWESSISYGIIFKFIFI